MVRSRAAESRRGASERLGIRDTKHGIRESGFGARSLLWVRGEDPRKTCAFPLCT